MDAVFLKLLNMSIAAGWLILAVTVLRLFLRKAPGWLVCILWGLVAVRLLCPFGFESSFSLIPSVETIKPAGVLYAEESVIDSGFPALNSTLNPIIDESFVSDAHNSVNPLQIAIWTAGCIWFAGMCTMIVYLIVSFYKIRQKVREAVPLRDNIWICDNVKSPFIMGIIKPRIYLSSATDSGQMEYVLAHEQAHLKRRDHWWKMLGYLLLATYWFHPLVWVAYLLFCRDLELACDEKVIKGMDLEGKCAYANALVSCSVQKRAIMACPLAFGEVGVKERVKTVLHYKKPAFWIVLAAVAVCTAVAVCFLTDPKSEEAADENVKYAMIPMIMVDDKYYYDTGTESTGTKQGADFDGEITSNIDGSKVQFENHWYNTKDLSDETIEWLKWYNSRSEMDRLAVSSVPGDLWELWRYGKYTDVEETGGVTEETGENGGTGVDVGRTNSETGADELLTEEEIAYRRERKAIKDAILAHNESSETKNCAKVCCDFVCLGTSTEDSTAPYTPYTPYTVEAAERVVTYYGWVLYEEYDFSEKGIEEVGGIHIPAAITFEVDGEGYHLKEYWEPREGSYFVPDVRKKFPAQIAEDGIDSQKYIMQQKQNCYQQAVQGSGLGAEAVVADLLDTICSSPAVSSNPQDYIDAHPIEYRELMYYGEYTLRYCLNRFAQEKEMGLEGHIMARVCEELLQTKGKIPVDAAEAETGQFWYDTLSAHAGNLVEPYLYIQE